MTRDSWRFGGVARVMRGYGIVEDATGTIGKVQTAQRHMVETL